MTMAARTCVKKMLQLSQRTYSVLTSVGGKHATLPERSPPSKLVEPQEKKQAYWMRDPITGYWKPEDHFIEIDAAQLRAKLIPKKD